MATIKICPGCQKPLPDGAPDGLCPECLMKAGLGTDAEIGLETQGESAREPAAAPRPEAMAPHFPDLEILELLGHGGMGAVYKARQPHLNRFVALKILRADKGQDPAFAGRFEREAQTLARFNHPNIVTLYDFGKVDGLYYLLMEYVDGVSLRKLLQTKKLSPGEALAIVPRICEALQYAHEHGVVHRDIKPENVLLNTEGRVKIADFGIAKMIGLEAGQSTITQDQQVIGTPHYMAPEQIEHPQEVDHRADIYSLGVVFYEMLTGELPLGKFQAPSRKVQVDVRLDEVVLHALEREPERRYQQASAVKSDVETIATTFPAASQREELPGQKPAPGRDYGLIAAAAAEQKPRLSRVAICGAACVPLCFFVFLLLFTVSQQINLSGGPPRRTWFAFMLTVTLLALGGVAAFGTTLLGGIAISQIRHSRGRLYGLGLAVFDALLFPLLALNAGLIAGWSWLVHQVIQEWIPVIGRAWFSVLTVGLMLTSCVVLTSVIAWAVWRGANRAVRSGDGHPPATAAGSAPRAVGAGSAVGAVAAVLILVAILAGVVLLPNMARHESRLISADHYPAVRVGSYHGERAFAVQQKLLREVVKRLESANYRWEQLSLAIHYFVNPDIAECNIQGLRKPVSEGLQSGSPVQPFDALAGALEIRHTGHGLWTIRGSGDLAQVNFTVDTAAEMASP